MIVMVLISMLPAIAGGKLALVIGVSEYQKHKRPELNWQPIHGANDAALISGTLAAQGFSVERLTGRKATADGMRRALQRLERRTKAGDMVYIHFSGHGQPVEDTSGDEPDGWDEAIVPYDAGQRYVAGIYEGDKHITDDELNVYVSGIRRRAGQKGFVYVVIDACHAGGASRGEDTEEDTLFVRGTNAGFSRSGKPFVPRIDKRPVIRIPGGANMAGACYLEACRSYQTNTEIKADGHYYGPLTYYINKVIWKHRLTNSTAWTAEVRRMMAADIRLQRQNMVVEQSRR